jgi:hypothetical protein
MAFRGPNEKGVKAGCPSAARIFNFSLQIMKRDGFYLEIWNYGAMKKSINTFCHSREGGNPEKTSRNARFEKNGQNRKSKYFFQRSRRP